MHFFQGVLYGCLLLLCSMIPFQFTRGFSLLSKFTKERQLRNQFTSIQRKMSSTQSHSQPIKVLVAVADGSEEIETVTVIDTLVRAGADVVTGSVANSKHVTCSRGVHLTANCLIEQCQDEAWDMVVCPGGMPGATHLSQSSVLKGILERQCQEGRYIGAICAAPAVVLATHNLLNNKRATCYPVQKFVQKIPNFSEDLVVVDGNIITSQGPGTSLHFSLKLVEILFSHERAEQLKKEMLFQL